MRTSTGFAAAADAADCALLEGAQELSLHRQGHLADLVEEERAAVAPARRGRAASASAPVNAPRS